MSITIESTTDSSEAVTAAIGNQAPAETVEETKSASAEKSADEKSEDSEPSKKADRSESEKTTSDADDDDDSDSDESTEDKEEQKPKKRSGFKRRIDKLNQRLSERDREIEYLRQEAFKKGQEPTEKKPATAVTPETSDRPKPDAFDSHEDYVEALADWKVENKLREREAKVRESQVKLELENKVKAHTDRVKSFADAHDDFHERMEDVDDIPMSLTVQEVILASDNGPELMYELAKNPEEYARICKLPAVQAARELGKFEARISSSQDTKKETKQLTKTKAPPPIKPVGSKASSVTKSPDDMDFQEFKRWREAQIRR